jgi:hypothetical protein
MTARFLFLLLRTCSIPFLHPALWIEVQSLPQGCCFLMPIHQVRSFPSHQQTSCVAVLSATSPSPEQSPVPFGLTCRTFRNHIIPGLIQPNYPLLVCFIYGILSLKKTAKPLPEIIICYPQEFHRLMWKSIFPTSRSSYHRTSSLISQKGSSHDSRSASSAPIRPTRPSPTNRSHVYLVRKQPTLHQSRSATHLALATAHPLRQTHPAGWFTRLWHLPLYSQPGRLRLRWPAFDRRHSRHPGFCPADCTARQLPRHHQTPSPGCWCQS